MSRGQFCEYQDICSEISHIFIHSYLIGRFVDNS